MFFVRFQQKTDKDFSLSANLLSDSLLNANGKEHKNENAVSSLLIFSPMHSLE